jgi:dUTPase
MTRASEIALAIIGFAVSIAPLGAVAAAPRTDAAPEALVIDVISMTTVTVDDTRMMKVRAKVIEVKKSEAGVKPGQSIVILYVKSAAASPGAARSPSSSLRSRGGCGSAGTPSMRQLVEKERYNVFLRKFDDGNFYPGASYVSFQTPIR